MDDVKLLSRKIRIQSTGVVPEKITFCEREYLIVPTVAVVQGVMVPGNIGEPELALMSEFNKSLGAWNGRPVTLGHPKNSDDEEVSANLPDIYESFAFGMLFNASINDEADPPQFEVEAWIDIERADTLGGNFKDCADRLADGEIMELSTGLFCLTIPTSGKYKDKKYNGVWRNIQPDHLAMLPDWVGACSNEDGCGTNRNNGAMKTLSADESSAMRKTLAADESRIEGEHTVKPKVTQGKCACGGDKNSSSDHLTCKCPVDNSRNMAEVKPDPKILKANVALAAKLIANIVDASTGISDADLRTALTSVLPEACSVIAVYTDSVVYVDYMEWAIYEAPYTKDANGNCTVDLDNAVAVRPMTQYVPVTGKENKMATEKTAAEVAAEATAAATAASVVAAAAAKANEAKPINNATTAELLAVASPEAKSDILAGLALLKKDREAKDNARKEATTRILAAKQNKFVEADLTGMSYDAVMNIASLLVVDNTKKPKVDYSGNGGGTQTIDDADDGNDNVISISESIKAKRLADDAKKTTTK